METEITAGTCPAHLPTWGRQIARTLAVTAKLAMLAGALGLAWFVRSASPYTSGSDLGYWLGVAGGSLILVLLIYPLRKRFRMLAVLGPMKLWFRFHLAAGILGPAIILFHSTFRTGSFNAAIALASMLLVVASGLVGRFLYRKIHNGLYGSRASAEQLRQSLERQLEALQPMLAQLPAAGEEIRRFSALVARQSAGHSNRVVAFITIDWHRWQAGRRIRRALGAYAKNPACGSDRDSTRLIALADTINAALGAVHRAALFSTYERLFSLWHVIHIPFLCMLLVTAIVHVVAVHAY